MSPKQPLFIKNKEVRTQPDIIYRVMNLLATPCWVAFSWKKANNQRPPEEGLLSGHTPGWGLKCRRGSYAKVECLQPELLMFYLKHKLQQWCHSDPSSSKHCGSSTSLTRLYLNSAMFFMPVLCMSLCYVYKCAFIYTLLYLLPCVNLYWYV